MSQKQPTNGEIILFKLYLKKADIELPSGISIMWDDEIKVSAKLYGEKILLTIKHKDHLDQLCGPLAKEIYHLNNSKSLINKLLYFFKSKQSKLLEQKVNLIILGKDESLWLKD